MCSSGFCLAVNRASCAYRVVVGVDLEYRATSPLVDLERSNSVECDGAAREDECEEGGHMRSHKAVGAPRLSTQNRSDQNRARNCW
jgi:hypothetical protein